MNNLTRIASVAVLTVTPWLTANAEEISPTQKKEIEAIVRSYLVENPEILVEMSQRLEAKQRNEEDKARKSALTGHAKSLFKLAEDPVAGNPKGDVTVVEFMDYNCGWCKKSVIEISKILEQDKDLRVVFKEFPIFGEGSEYAAKAALASRKQDAYWKFHLAMFQHEGQINAEVADSIAASIGLDLDKLKKDMDDPEIAASLAKTRELAQSLQLTGTPAFVIDETVVPGYITHDRMIETIAGVRANGGCKIC